MYNANITQYGQQIPFSQPVYGVRDFATIDDLFGSQNSGYRPNQQGARELKPSSDLYDEKEDVIPYIPLIGQDGQVYVLVPVSALAYQAPSGQNGVDSLSGYMDFIQGLQGLANSSYIESSGGSDSE